MMKLFCLFFLFHRKFIGEKIKYNTMLKSAYMSSDESATDSGDIRRT